MSKHIYNFMLLAGVSLVGVGISLWSLSAGLAVTGFLLIGLTLASASLSKGK